MAVTVHFVQDDGAEKVVSGEVGETLMEVGREQNVAGILGDCGGGASCATCHVYVDPQWQARTGKADDVELATLDMVRSEEHTSELQSLMRISYAVFCLKKKKKANKYDIQKRRNHKRI